MSINIDINTDINTDINIEINTALNTALNTIMNSNINMNNTIRDILCNNLLYNTVQLTNEEIIFIKDILLNNPQILYKINTEINTIISDGKIDLHDLPQIILLISDIYTSHIIDNYIENISLVNIIKFTIDSIVYSNILPLPNIDIFIIKKIIDSSISLLQFNINFIKKEKISCFNYLFGK